MNGADLHVFLLEVNGANPLFCTCIFKQKRAKVLNFSD